MKGTFKPCKVIKMVLAHVLAVSFFLGSFLPASASASVSGGDALTPSLFGMSQTDALISAPQNSMLYSAMPYSVSTYAASDGASDTSDTEASGSNDYVFRLHEMVSGLPVYTEYKIESDTPVICILCSSGSFLYNLHKTAYIFRGLKIYFYHMNANGVLERLYDCPAKATARYTYSASNGRFNKLSYNGFVYTNDYLAVKAIGYTEYLNGTGYYMADFPVGRAYYINDSSDVTKFAKSMLENNEGYFDEVTDFAKPIRTTAELYLPLPMDYYSGVGSKPLLNNISLSDDGVISYDVAGVPSDARFSGVQAYIEGKVTSDSTSYKGLNFFRGFNVADDITVNLGSAFNTNSSYGGVMIHFQPYYMDANGLVHMGNVADCVIPSSNVAFTRGTNDFSIPLFTSAHQGIGMVGSDAPLLDPSRPGGTDPGGTDPGGTGGGTGGGSGSTDNSPWYQRIIDAIQAIPHPINALIEVVQSQALKIHDSLYNGDFGGVVKNIYSGVIDLPTFIIKAIEKSDLYKWIDELRQNSIKAPANVVKLIEDKGVWEAINDIWLAVSPAGLAKRYTESELSGDIARIIDAIQAIPHPINALIEVVQSQALKIHNAIYDGKFGGLVRDIYNGLIGIPTFTIKAIEQSDLYKFIMDIRDYTIIAPANIIKSIEDKGFWETINDIWLAISPAGLVQRYKDSGLFGDIARIIQSIVDLPVNLAVSLKTDGIKGTMDKIFGALDASSPFNLVEQFWDSDFGVGLRAIWDFTLGFRDNLISDLKDVASYLVIPSDDFMNENDAVLLFKQKFAFVTDVYSFIFRIVNAIDVKNPPEFYIDLSVGGGGKYGTEKVKIDFSWYAPYKPYGDTLLSALFLGCYAWNVFLHFPSYISGIATGTAASARAYKRFDD